jgi:ABC-type transporter Mla subunit MlaD
MFILNLILYNPLTTLMNQRNDYILDNLSKASEMLVIAADLTSKYEAELTETKKDAQQEIAKLQKLQKENFDNELNISQKYFDTVIQNILDNFEKDTISINKILSFEIKNLVSHIKQNVWTLGASVDELNVLRLSEEGSNTPFFS